MRVDPMWKKRWQTLWKIWTIDKPALLGDWLWDVFVVQLAAALMDRQTWKRIFAIITLGILVAAYHNRIPIPPELMIVGDLLAYIDIVSAAILLGMLSRAATIVFVVKQATARIARLASGLMREDRRRDFRHRRARRTRIARPLIGRSKTEDDEAAALRGLAWA